MDDRNKFGFDEAPMLKKLSEVCLIQSGGTPSRSVQAYWHGGTIPWAKISDFDGKYLSETEELITDEGLAHSSAKIVSKGSILYSIFATLGETCILNIDAATNQAIAGLTLQNDELDTQYLYYYLKSLKSKVNEMGRGVAQNNINLGILKNFTIPIYSMQTQKMIVRRLESIENIIVNRQRQLEQLDTLIKARFVEMFGDLNSENVKGLKFTIAEAISDGYIEKPMDGNHGGKHPKVADYVSSGIPFLMANNLNDGKVDFEKCAFITKKQADSLDKGFAKDGDVLVTHKGTIGRTAILRCPEYEYVMLTPQITYYRIRKGLSREYLKGYFDSEYFQNIITNIAGIGSTRAYIGITAQQELPLIIPNLEDQNLFADFVHQVDKSKVAVQKSLDELQTLFDSLMQEYFG